MIRIVMDTNTLISGTFWLVAPTEVITFVEEGKIELILSKEILEEYNKVINYDEIKNPNRSRAPGYFLTSN